MLGTWKNCLPFAYVPRRLPYSHNMAIRIKYDIGYLLAQVLVLVGSNNAEWLAFIVCLFHKQR